jgi:hypothetical protein
MVRTFIRVSEAVSLCEDDVKMISMFFVIIKYYCNVCCCGEGIGEADGGCAAD